MAENTRKIPATMATQHPDHGGRPYWLNECYIPAIEEAKECFLCFSDLGISEYKWDWEGKLVDESVLERLVGEWFEYFKKHPLGREKFLTFRLPNPKVENEFRMGRALMGMLTAASLAKQVGLYSPPLFEVILPMTESAKEMIDIQEAFAEIASLKHRLNKFEKELLSHIQIIPLFEQVSTIINSVKILRKYLNLHFKKFGFKPNYLRPYVARSDPALNSGLVPTILAIKIAFSRYRQFETKHNIKLYPVIGVGTLPFRGGINPSCLKYFLREYKGVRTAIIQSAFRYDFPKNQVKKAIAVLNSQLPKGKTKIIPKDEEKEILELLPYFERAYKSSVEKIAPLVNHLAIFLPKRRERVQHIGLFGYSRGLGAVKLPRAISFTAVMYSLGVPPELIGTGRGLLLAQKKDKLDLIKKYYVNLKSDMLRAGRFLYKPGLNLMAKKSQAWKNILKDVENIEKVLKISLCPRTLDEQMHYWLSAKFHKSLRSGRNLTKLIQQQALLRKSMG